MPKVRRRTIVRRRRKKDQGLDLQDHTRRQVSAVVQIALGLILLLALRKSAGPLGDSLSRGVVFLLGQWGILLPLFFIASGVMLLIARTPSMENRRSLGLLLLLLSFLGLVQLQASLEDIGTRRDQLAGAIGFLMSFPFAMFLSKPVGLIVLFAALCTGIFLIFEPDLPALWESVMGTMSRKENAGDDRKKRDAKQTEKGVIQDVFQKVSRDLVEQDKNTLDLNIVRPAFAVEKRAEDDSASKDAKQKVKPNGVLEMKDTRFEEWKFPELDLLERKHSTLTINDAELKTQASLIREKLQEFDIDVTMKDAHPGPTVTQFTLQPAEGIKLSKIESLKDDLALALAAQSLRIEAPIPGKALVGIEMPNVKRSTVYLRELLESHEFRKSESPLTIPMGRGVSGDAMVADISEMPHLLIAGATGSGKSVSMNAFLISLLYQNAPHELKFILIDPKRVELMPYNGIPHLLTPVITESDKALQALRWALAEMGRRLHRFSETGARNLQEYNDKQTSEEHLLPRIVIVIDELADLMMRQHRKDTETMIARIAQMARAVGMHLIVATQRPSVDVVTGLIKANIPTRIAFRVVSAIDSRTIIDSIGAEDLLGKGDMLYMNASNPKPIRIQGIYISTKESERVINAIKVAGGGMLTEEITLGEGDAPGGSNDSIPQIDLEADDNGGDDLFFDAVRVVQETGKASASLLQRQLKVGYARAARLLDIMEEKGVVGPLDGAKPRKVYIEKMATGTEA